MSKEMTPKEAFQSLVEIYDITKSSKQCKIINKALNSVEETKTNYHTALAFCEASKEEKQELHKQIEQLEKENQALRDKLNINFEDCANELCEALTQRDKLYDENLELQKENQELTLLNETQANIINELQQHRNSVENQNAALKIKVRAWEIQSEKFKKIIDILKSKKVDLVILLSSNDFKEYNANITIRINGVTYLKGNNYTLTQKEYDLLKEFLENV